MPKATLGELMGKVGTQQGKGKRKLTLDDLSDLLGEKMPKLEFSPVGRLRLQGALRNRFGDGYKNIPGISDIMDQFDDEAKFAVKIQEMKQIKAARK